MELPDITNKNVLIIGCPGSGKTYVSSLLKSPEHTIIHTDDYAKMDFDTALYLCLARITDCKTKTIVEGVQGYRLLRKGVELDVYYPDIVIELCITDAQQQKVYSKERDVKKLAYQKSFAKSHQTILKEYKRMPNRKKPVWIKINNQF